jgi:lipoprotein-releasing system ATP-binding protein
MTMLAIKADSLSRTYTGEGAPVTVFSNLSFSVPEGTFAAIMGPSGVGKSTLLHLLGGIDRPDSGRVEVFGQAIDELSPRARARFRNEKVGFVFQFHHLLPEFTAEENVAMPHRIAGVAEGAARRMAAELLARVGLADRRDHGARALSGGEQQRVAIARALARGPGLLLADEPTGNLDSASAQAVFALLRELHAERGMTTILVTHNPDLARRCDRLFTMSREGIAVAQGLSERG